VLDGRARSASIMTLEPCRLFMIPRGDVERLLDSNPVFARDLIEKLIGLVRSLSNKVRDLGLKDVYGRFVAFIGDHAIEQDGKQVVPSALTQQEIAAASAPREMVSRIVSELTEAAISRSTPSASRAQEAAVAPVGSASRLPRVVAHA